MAASAPANPHVIALTRLTDIPHNRAASGLLAAARICCPNEEKRRNSVRPMTRVGTRIMVRTDMPFSTTRPI